MPQQPYLSESVTEGALGLSAGDALSTFAVIGIASGGTGSNAITTNAVYGPFNNVPAAVAALVKGPGLELLSQALTECRGKAQFLFVCPTPTTGSLVAGTRTGTGLATVVDSSSTPNDDYDLVVKIAKAGVLATATFLYSVDGGRTWSDEIATGASYAIPGTGVTLAFSSTPGAFVAGDTYPFEAKGPGYNVAALNTAVDALTDDGRDFSLLGVAGIPADTSVMASVIAAVQAKLETAAIKHRPARAIIDGPEGVTNTAMRTATNAIPSSPRVVLGADFCALASVTTPGRVEKRPVSWPIFARACAVPISVALHATDPSESGPLNRSPGVKVGLLKSRLGDKVAYSYHDETLASVSLDDARCACLRTWPGESAIYINRARTMAALGTDYSQLHHGRIMDQAQRVAYRYMFQFIAKRLRVNAQTGVLAEGEAVSIETAGRQLLVKALVNEGHASDVQFVVIRGDNLISTSKLRYKVRVIPPGYPDYIDGEFGLLNPALDLQAAA